LADVYAIIRYAFEELLLFLTLPLPCHYFRRYFSLFFFAAIISMLLLDAAIFR